MNSKVAKSSYDTDSEQVAVMTIHSSKGLEFSRVIMLMGTASLGKEFGSGEIDVIKENELLLYVAMTRA